MDKKLKTILYKDGEFKNDRDFHAWIRTLSLPCVGMGGVCMDPIHQDDVEMDDIDIVCVNTDCVEDNMEYDSCLWITSQKKYIQMAKDKHIAVLGYQGAGVTEFLPVEYVIQGFEGIDEKFLERVFCRFHNMPWEILETRRCVVREFAMEDLDALFDLYAKPGMTDFVEPLYSYEEEAAYEEAYIKHRYRYYGYGMWLVFDKESGKLIGRAGLENRDYPEGTAIELGYMIAPEYQGKGYATEVCRAILTYAKEELEAESVNCLVDEKNVPSVRLVEKLGFTYEGKTDITGVNLNRYNIDFFR